MSRAALLVALLTACSPEQSTGSTVRVSLAPQSNATARTFSAPVRLEYRILAIYLSNNEEGTNIDVDGDGIDTVRIWEDPGCGGDLGACDASPSDDGTYSLTPTTWLDLTLPAADVNAQLNSQDVGVPAQTWRRVGLEACKVNEGSAPTVRWEGVAAVPAEYDDCGFVEVRFDEPLETTGTEQLELSLTYDLSETLQIGDDAEGDSCVAQGDVRECVSLPTFSLEVGIP